MTLSIRNLAGTYVHASVDLVCGAGLVDRPAVFEFNIQVKTLGGPGVGEECFGACGSLLSAVAAGTSINAGNDTATFDSTNGVEYYLYGINSTPASAPVFARQLAYAVVEA